MPRPICIGAVELVPVIEARDLSFSSTIEVESQSVEFISVIEASKSVIFFSGQRLIALSVTVTTLTDVETLSLQG